MPAQPDSLVGTAEVTTPILDQPLTGRAYLRSSSSGLPDLAIDLEGQVDFELVGRVDAVNARYRTTFKTVPDVPVSTFKLDLLGGRKGLLQNSESLCGKSSHFTVRMIGQNGAHVNSKPLLQTTCGSKARHRRHHKKKAGH